MNYVPDNIDKLKSFSKFLYFTYISLLHFGIYIYCYNIFVSGDCGHVFNGLVCDKGAVKDLLEGHT